MKILIDLQSCQTASKYRGIGRYSIELAEAMIREGVDKHEFFILLNLSLSDSLLSIRSKFEPLIGKDNIVIFGCPNNIGFINQRIDVENITHEIREWAIKQVAPDFVHISSYFEGFSDNSISQVFNDSEYQTAVTLYDLIPLINEDVYLELPLMNKWYKKRIEDLQHTDLVFSISESAKKEGIDYAHLDSEHIVNISSAISSEINTKIADKQHVFDKFSIDDGFILYTGNVDPRKNLLNLFFAYKLMPKDLRLKNKLIVVVKYDEHSYVELVRMAKSAALEEDEYFLTGYITDEELNLLYSECSVFVFPSLHEGFGLPCLEAMAFDAPVIGSNTTSIPEVIALEEALFDPTSPQAIADAIHRVLTVPEFKEKLIKNAKDRMKVFSWQKSAKVAINAMEIKYKQKNQTIEFGISHYDNFFEVLRSKAFESEFSDADLIEIAHAIDSTEKKEKKSIYVDVTVLSKINAKTGIQRVVKSILDNLICIDSKYQIYPVYLEHDGLYYFDNSMLAEAYGADKKDNFVVNPTLNDVFIGLDLIADRAESATKVLTSWREKGVKINFIVYDLLPLKIPDYFPRVITNVFLSWVEMVLRVSDHVISISESVSHDVQRQMETLGLKRELPIMYSSFPLGADIAEKDIQSNFKLPNEISNIVIKQSFLMVGTIEPRKGHDAFINGFENFIKENEKYNLIIVGKAGWKTEKLQSKLNKLKAMSRIIWLDKCNDETLSYLYNNSCALVSSSYGEGFGLPLIEGSNYGLPLFIRNIEVFREVAGNNAFYFDGDEQITSKLEEWTELYEADGHPKSEGLEITTWKQSAEYLLKEVIK